jgi:hypothetical protein
MEEAIPAARGAASSLDWLQSKGASRLSPGGESIPHLPTKS